MRLKIAIYALSTVLFSACANMGVQTLAPDNYQSLEPTDLTKYAGGAVALEEYNGTGVISEFEKEGIGNWWGSSKILLSKKNGALVVNASGVGKEYDRFGYSFAPVVDFTNRNILKVRVKAIGNMIPTLRIDLKDKNGFVTNSQDAKARLVLCDEYINYYYRYEGRFRQGWPFKADVNPKEISELEIFINPGGENFSGIIEIDDIRSVTEKQMWEEISKQEPACDVSPDNDFKEHVKFCWPNSDVYQIFHEDEAMKVEVKGGGSDWQSFGVGFSMSDLGERPVIRVKAKAVGDQACQLRLDLVDLSGNSTNGQAMEFTVPNDGEYRDFYYDFQDKLYQGWPTAGKVDPHYITELMLFTNPGGPGFYGDLYIDEIEVVKNYEGGEKPRFANYKKETLNAVVLYDIADGENTWWEIKDGAATKLGTGFDVVDMTQRKQIQLVVPKGSSPMKLKLMDNRGEASSLVEPSSVEEEQGAVVLTYDLANLLKSNSAMNAKIITGCVLESTAPVEVQRLTTLK